MGESRAAKGRRLTSEERVRPRRDDVRAAIRATADEHFLAVGYRAASLEQIARAAGFTKGAVYSNFTSKPALFLELLGERIDTFSRDVEEHRGAVADDPADVIEMFSARLAHEVVTEARWHRCVVEFALEAAGAPEVMTAYAELRERRYDDVVSRLQGAGIHVAVGGDGRALAASVVAAVNGFAVELGSRADAVDESRIARAIRGLIIAFIDHRTPRSHDRAAGAF